MIKAAIFDMDGLLIDSEPLWAQAFKDAFGTLKVKITDADMREVRGTRNNESVEYLFHKYDLPDKDRQKIENLTVDDMIELIRKKGKLLPGVHKTFEICEQAGLQMAIASSSYQRIINTVLDTLAIRQHFECVYSAENEAYGKPHPGVFITTAEILGVASRHCLVFEDSPSGVLAAKAAKMKCVAVPEPALKNHKFIQAADLILDSLADFDRPTLEAL